MGNLKPDTTYIYERVGDITYARELGADPSTRFEVGMDWDPGERPSALPGSVLDQIREDKIWGEIRRAALTNTSLHAELERVKMLYYLIKNEDKPLMWHPV